MSHRTRHLTSMIIMQLPMDVSLERLVDKLQEAAASFPELAEVSGHYPWMPRLLDEMLVPLEPHRRQAGLLLLEFWKPGHVWRSGRFDLLTALASWSDKDLEAFGKLCRDPFFAAYARAVR